MLIGFALLMHGQDHLFKFRYQLHSAKRNPIPNNKVTLRVDVFSFIDLFMVNVKCF